MACYNAVFKSEHAVLSSSELKLLELDQYSIPFHYVNLKNNTKLIKVTMPEGLKKIKIKNGFKGMKGKY